MENQFAIKVISDFDLVVTTRLLLLFNKKKIFVKSVHVLPNAETNEFHHSYIISGSNDKIINVTRIIAKQIGIHKVFWYQINRALNYEVAIFKVPIKEFESKRYLSNLFRKENVRVISMEKDYMLVEKTGFDHEIQKLYKKLKNYQFMDFQRSGTITISA